MKSQQQSAIRLLRKCLLVLRGHNKENFPQFLCRGKACLKPNRLSTQTVWIQFHFQFNFAQLVLIMIKIYQSCIINSYMEVKLQAIELILANIILFNNLTIPMKNNKELPVSPWEIPHEEKALLDIQIAPKIHHQEERQKMLLVIHQKRMDQNGSQKSSLIVKPKYLNSISHTTKTTQKPVRQKLKTHYDSKKTYLSGNKQEREIEQKPKEYRKWDLSIKPIAKNDLTINIPLIGIIQSKIGIDRPIKHMPKGIKQSPLNSQRKGYRNEIKELDKKLIGKQSVDSLSRRNMNYEVALKKTQEYQDQIIKKCSLKNIRIYDQQNPSQKQTKKTETIKKIRIENKKHILDRILTKFE